MNVQVLKDQELMEELTVSQPVRVFVTSEFSCQLKYRYP